ncbi:2-hydroxy-3-oxopropionate reductase [Propionivibrio dicarboxylicus]|uniref:Tartronate semialdehyde reductase n=1 Tax=Propionivibrio dicarboxylicus TaxID=83767 RepID=A0A1G8J1M7_9RHOO|nr:tartronate semialdehyde reductase [Propionivibrio dicarboxylicus]
MHIGFIGLGIMGRPMAKNLLKAGYPLTVYTRSSTTDDLVALGAKAAPSCKALAEQCDVIFTMLPNSPQVREVVMGKDGVLEGAKPGTILVDMSSIAPAAAQEICEAAHDKGVVMLDAPVSGGEPKAIDGTLAIMVGGDARAFETVKPILEKMGSSAVLLGGIGAGNVTKLANQIIVALNIAAVSEAFVLATKAGVDPAAVFDAIKGGLAGSTIMNAKLPMILSGNFEPGGRLEFHTKDLRNVLDTSHRLNVSLPLTGAMMQIFEALIGDGMAKNDHCAVVRYYEKLAKVEVRAGAC